MIRQLIAAALAVFAFNAFAAVDVNRASQAELESVKGIGPGLSAKIISQRQSGAFKNWADMVDRVPGVGDGNAARFSQAGLTVAGASYSAAPKPVHAAKAAKSAKATMGSGVAQGAKGANAATSAKAAPAAKASPTQP